ncbi:PEP-CTERM sorting domain-containing protein [Ferribacterium limneticum]|uniref:PEP-CTERM sorting domain-containing protein n=1 Tax=Ferribacterium limneticum TaxID=76259 RepID=UPI001CF87939|nr:PEP-CTERM sorting domain-containing protein [Ferribacterium limneticum]UCV23502.1 PEP-CTERM sorting domain-containing protein [Ferribacterium limneticum]
MFNQLKPLAALIATALISTSALAATQTLDAGNYTISYDDAALGMFGIPTLTASGISFAPSGDHAFSVESFSGMKLASSTVAFTITADAGYTLSAFNLSENGTYLKFGDGSKVSLGGSLTVQDLVNTSSTVTKAVALSSPLSNSTTFEDLEASSWNASAGALLSTGKATVSITDKLGAWAFAESDGYASIAKSNVILDVNVTAVPEPQSFAMLLAGLGVVGAMVRRRRNGV